MPKSSQFGKDYTGIKIKISRTIILPVVLYRCETWSVTLRKEHRLRVLEDRVVRKIFQPKRDKVTGDWRRRYDLYSSPNIIWVNKRNVMDRACRMYGGKGAAYRVLEGKLEGKDHLEDLGIDGRIIKVDLQEVVWWGAQAGLIDSMEDRDRRQALVKAVINCEKFID